MTSLFKSRFHRDSGTGSTTSSNVKTDHNHIEHAHDESPEEWEARHDYYTRYPNSWARIRDVIREPAAEALGCMILILFGNGVDCQVVLSGNTAVASSVKGQYLSISFIWAVGAALGVWVCGGVSGGHINPAITICLATFRGFPWKKVPGYILGQCFGAWLGALLTYANYFHAIDLFEGGKGVRTTPGTASLFSVYALDYMTAANCFFDEFLGTFILVIVIFAVIDARNMPPPPGLLSIVVFLVILGLGAGWGMQTGYAVNPARDIGPRIMTSMVGYGHAVYNYRSQFWLWCPILGPIAGGLVGGLVYDVFIYTGSESWLNTPTPAARRHLASARPSGRVNPVAGPPPADKALDIV